MSRRRYGLSARDRAAFGPIPAWQILTTAEGRDASLTIAPLSPHTDELNERTAKAVARGYLYVDNGKYALTPLGRQYVLEHRPQS